MSIDLHNKLREEWARVWSNELIEKELKKMSGWIGEEPSEHFKDSKKRRERNLRANDITHICTLYGLTGATTELQEAFFNAPHVARKRFVKKLYKRIVMGVDKEGRTLDRTTTDVDQYITNFIGVYGKT